MRVHVAEPETSQYYRTVGAEKITNTILGLLLLIILYCTPNPVLIIKAPILSRFGFHSEKGAACRRRAGHKIGPLP